MKFCTDCRHYKNPDTAQSGHEYGRCLSPQNSLGTSPVDGSAMRIFIFCTSLRERAEYRFDSEQVTVCGPDAVWHEEAT